MENWICIDEELLAELRDNSFEDVLKEECNESEEDFQTVSEVEFYSTTLLALSRVSNEDGSKKDALDTLDSNDAHLKINCKRGSLFSIGENKTFMPDNTTCDIIKSSSGIIRVHKMADDVENIYSESSMEDQSRRLSLKRKASPLKDRNVCAPLTFKSNRLRKLAKQPVMHYLPTIAESPVLLTKNRNRPRTAPESDRPERLVLKPVRKRNIGICSKPLPKPPTIPEPFNLTGPGKHVHYCYEDPPEREMLSSFNLPVTPGRKRIKKERTKEFATSKSISGTPNKCNPFSFYERDQEIMRRKLERMNTANQENDTKHEFRARSPSVLKKEPFRPEVPGRLVEGNRPELSTEERARRRARNGLFGFEEKKMEELENNLFIFKGQPGPKANSSFISTTSSSKRSFFNSSMASSIGSCSSDKSMAFSFYERDMEMMRRREERMKQVEPTKCEFKAKEPTVLSKNPFWPEIESRLLPESSSVLLATEKRAEERKKFEFKKKQAEERQKEFEKEFKKFEEEEIRKLRKTMEFKATSIMK